MDFLNGKIRPLYFKYSLFINYELKSRYQSLSHYDILDSVGVTSYLKAFTHRREVR